MVDHFVHDESQELLAEGGVEPCRVGQRPKPGDLYRFAIGVGGGKTNRGLVFADTFGDLEPFSKHMDERRIDVVDAVSALTEYLIVVHPTKRSELVPRDTIDDHEQSQ